MIVDVDRADPLPLAERYDVCIAGGGVAGITVAKALAERNQRVLLLEAGSLEYSDQSQDVYKGENIGHEYFDLDVARLRYFGGTSNHWTGWCRPLDASDFESKDHIEGSGWPIEITDLQPYLGDACAILEIGTFPPETGPLHGSNGSFKKIFFDIGEPVRFSSKYGDFISRSERIDLFLNSNLVDIVLDVDSGRVMSFVFRGYRDEAPLHRAVADRYVLALGGIENPRVLLNANRQRPKGVGNEADLVGRFFMEHPHFHIGYYLVDAARAPFGRERRFLAPTDAFMRQNAIGNAGLRLYPILPSAERGLTQQAKDAVKYVLCASDVLADLVSSVRPFRCPLVLPFEDAGRLRIASEQVPNPSSCVSLSDDTDRFGLRRARLDWRLSPVDKATMRACGLELGRYFARQEIGRVKLFDWVLADDLSFPGLEQGQELAGYHNMGTTRMGTTPHDGVVDRNCRVFGIDNLYIAGSSVFRTGGHANPTLTIVQLALRLADHLARV